MKGKLFLTLICLAFQNLLFSQMVDSETSSTAKPNGLVLEGDWKMTFSDEFNDTQIDGSKWYILNSESSRNPRPGLGISQWFWRPKNVLEQDGNLILKVEKYNNNTMTCGSINSNNRFEKAFGYYETRIKIAQADKGTHTAFWFQGDNMGNIDGTGRDGAEIDVFESAWTGDYTKSVVHIDGYGADHQASTKRYETPGLHEGFHTFGILWTPDYMKIYYDGILKITYSDPKFIPQVPEYIWLSDGASFGFSGDNFTREPLGFLTEAYVDYVRVWELDDYSCLTPKREVEDLDYASEGATVEIPSNTNASNGKQLRLLSDKVGDEVILKNVCHAIDGYYKYDLSGFANINSGQYKLSVEITTGVWHEFEQIIDFYSSTIPEVSKTFGAIYLESGNYNLKFTSVGKNNNSLGFEGVFDVLTLNSSKIFDATFLEGAGSEVLWSGEAEDATYTGVNALENCNNASNGKYINLNQIQNKNLKFSDVIVSESGTYVLNVRYISGNNRDANVYVNGQFLSSIVFESSGLWCFDDGEMAEKSISVNLNAGVNSITLTNNGQANLPIFDKISILKGAPDNDKDGIPDVYDTDDDNDGVPDLVDNCSTTANSNQLDSNQNGVGDACGGNALSTDIFNQESKILIYPNPTKGKITINLKEESNSLNLEIFDIRGKRIKKQVLEKEISEITMPFGVVKGIYILKFSNNSKILYRKILLD
ncbi:family 16 glycosylhydrolase [Polaribacter sp. Hel_I_88]|uniref:family 16 glycosylhydrolase n=1 Tax=Polaribacter sp. Hel_I_88 TaxID=1250006 RepID=UPI00047B8968|nr:family 16 glycosylhydrolase [Polaribacter sp. Hel_I_88]